jgi:hypothetical protein
VRVAHPSCVRFYDREIDSNERRQVDFVDHQQIGPRDSRGGFARNLFSVGDIDHVDRQVRQFRTDSGREIVTTGLNETEFGVRESTVHVVDRRQVHRRMMIPGSRAVP